MSVRYPRLETSVASDRRFDGELEDQREAFLLGYRYNTARAYYADLDCFFTWCAAANVDPRDPHDGDTAAYLAELEDFGYATSTIRRRQVCINLWLRSVRCGLSLLDTSANSECLSLPCGAGR